MKNTLFVSSVTTGSLLALALLGSGCSTALQSGSLAESRVVNPTDLPSGLIAPRVVKTVAPQFPYALKSAGIEGNVKLSCLVTESGEVRDIQIVDASESRFVDAATTALRFWKFEPGVRDGSPAAMRVMIPMVFNLDEVNTNRPAPSAGIDAAQLARH